VYESKFQSKMLLQFSGQFIYQSRRRHIPGEGKLHRHRCEDFIQGGSNMTGTDLCVNKPHCAAAVRP